MSPALSRGDVWLARLGPTRGHEQAGERPVVVVSADIFNRGPSGLVVVVPMTTRERGNPLHIEVNPPEGGVHRRSFIKCEDVRSISRERLTGTRWGILSEQSLSEVEDILRVILDL